MMTGRERIRRAITFQHPDRIPVSTGVPQATIDKYGEPLRALIAQFESDFGGSGWREGPDTPRPIHHSDSEWTDEWGVRWRVLQPGLMGIPVDPPLADWNALSSYQPPKAVHGDFREVAQSLSDNRNGKYVIIYGGRLFERMQWLRGAESLLADLAYPERELYLLRDRLVEHLLVSIDTWLKYDIDAFSFEDDWGGQKSLLISPARWREFFRPAYERLLEPILRAGKQVFFHTDGVVWDIMPDFIDLGIACMNVQYGLLGLERLGKECGGRLAFHLDLEGQYFMPNANPDQVREHIWKLVKTLGSFGGGLILDAWVTPDVPWANIAAMFETFNEVMCA